MKQSSKRLFSSLLALLFLFGAFMIYFSLIQPSYASLLETRGQLVARGAFLDKQRSVVEQVERIIETFTSNPQYREAISIALPEGPHAIEAVHQMNGIIANNNLHSDSYDIQIESAQRQRSTREQEADASFTPPPVSKGTISFTVKGTYEDFKSFLSDLETNIRIMDVASLALQRTDDPLSNLFEGAMDVTFYYQEKESQ